MLLRVTDPSHRGLLRELLLAHEFWHAHGLKVDLVVVNEHPAGYFDSFQEQLLEADPHDEPTADVQAGRRVFVAVVAAFAG